MWLYSTLRYIVIVLAENNKTPSTILVDPGSQSTYTKVCRIGRGAQLGAIGPIGLRPTLTVTRFVSS